MKTQTFLEGYATLVVTAVSILGVAFLYGRKHNHWRTQTHEG